MRTTSGYDWIWFPTRLAIYARDGNRCLACGSTDRLSLDHVRRPCDGGSDRPENLITLCNPCHRARFTRSLADWRPDLVAVARRQTRRKLDRVSARRLAAELRPDRFAAARARNARRGQPTSACAGVPF